MKILLLLDTDQIAGTEHHLLTLAREMVALGEEVFLACRAGGRLSQLATGSNLVVVPMDPSNRLRANVSCLRRFMRTTQIDLVHAHNGRTMRLARLVKIWTGIPIVATQHFIDPHHASFPGPLGWLLQTAHAWLSRGFDRWIAVSEGARAAMLRRKAASANRISIVHNGVEAQSLDPLTSPVVIRQELGISSDTAFILYVGRLEAEKDVESLIVAISQLGPDGRPFACVIAGDGALRTKLETMIHHLKVESKVRLIGFRKDTAALMHAADLLVLPSPCEPFGLVLIEAMSARLPVIAIRAGGPLDIVVDRSTGILVTPGSPSEMAVAITEMLSKPTDASAMGERGYQRYLSHFTARTMATRTLDVYREAISGHTSLRAEEPLSACASS